MKHAVWGRVVARAVDEKWHNSEYSVHRPFLFAGWDWQMSEEVWRRAVERDVLGKDATDELKKYLKGLYGG